MGFALLYLLFNLLMADPAAVTFDFCFDAEVYFLDLHFFFSEEPLFGVFWPLVEDLLPLLPCLVFSFPASAVAGYVTDGELSWLACEASV